MMKAHYLFAVFIIILYNRNNTSASERHKLDVRSSIEISQSKITGIVIDKNGSIAGASIAVIGTKIRTQTDQAGKFSIDASIGNKIMISSIGYLSREIEVTSNNLTIVLEAKESKIDEVVVTAFGITRDKKSLGYSAQTIGGEEIAQTQRSNFLNSLQGRIAGATITPTSGLPGASSQIIIRGATSLDGDNQPLFVVDGLPISNKTFDEYTLVGQGSFNRYNDYGNRVMDINPEEIQSITILKGPEASALYGTDGASGAVVITTKKARAGATKINYSNNFRIEDVYGFPNYQTVYGPGSSSTPGVIDDQIRTYFGAKYPEGTTFYNNLETFYQTGFSQKHNLAAEGGSDLLSLRTSFSYDKQKGTIPNTGFEQFNIKISGNSIINKKLKMNSSLNFISNSTDKTFKAEGSPMLSVLSWPITIDVADYLNPDGSRRLIDVDGSKSAELDNPFWSAYKNPNRDKVSRILGNFGVDYSPYQWLVFAAKGGFDAYSNSGLSAYHPQSYRGVATSGLLNTYSADNILLNGSLIATFRKDFGDFKPVLRLGTNIDDSRYEVIANQGQKFYVENFYSMNNTDPSTHRAMYTDIRKRKVGFFGNAELAYKELIYFTLTGRYDLSSTLPEQNQSFFYPAVSLSFVFSDLEFFKDVSWLTLGKLRASWGQSGKDARVAYITSTKLVAQTTTGGGFATDVTAGNPELEAEFMTSKEIGFDLELFKSRLSFDFSYYEQLSDKQITAPRLSYATSAILKYINSGLLRYRGFEFIIKGTPILKEKFSWDVSANFTRSKGIVLQLPADLSTFYVSDTWMFANVRTQLFEGSSPYAFGSYEFLKNQDGKLLISPSTGMPIKSADFVEMGDRTPDFSIGLSNSFTYKNFNLSMLIDIRKGGDIYNATELYLYQRGLSTLTLDRETPRVIEGVLRDGLENTATPTENNIQVIPYITTSYYTTYYSEEDFIERDINWLRLKDITIGYNLPKSLLGTSIFKSVNVFLTGTDLLLLTNYKGVDPQVNSLSAASGGIAGSGMDFGSVGLPRGFNFGLKVGF